VAAATLSAQTVISLTVMSICGVSAWWANNILNDITKVRIFVAMGITSAIYMVLSMW
jgi:hypothetical protein